MTAAAILEIGLRFLPLVTVGVPQFISWLQSLRASAQQSGEWTAEQDAAYTAALFAKTGDPAYQPDPSP